ncbi:unnamed protein product [Eretmochelys imbricata]
MKRSRTETQQCGYVIDDPQEPDPGADGLTYAELDGQVLQAKPGSPALAHEPAQPSVYAAINVSWGTPQ